ncbi:MAG: helix-turn-helix transcriptional regulator [Candidatus Brocadiales bacterium]
MGRLLKLSDICKLFGVTRWTIMNWVEKGEFPKPIRKGWHLRWPEEEIERLVERLKRNR